MNPVSEQEGRKRPGQSGSAGRFTRRGRGVLGGKARAEQQQVGGRGPCRGGSGPRTLALQQPPPSLSGLTHDRKTVPTPLGLLVLEEASVS